MTRNEYIKVKLFLMFIEADYALLIMEQSFNNATSALKRFSLCVADLH